MKIKLTKVYINDKDKEGKPFIGKNGAYSKIAVKCQEYGDRYLSGFVSQWNANWKIGDTVEVDIEEKGEYLNIHKPDPVAELEKRVRALENQFAQFINQPQADEGPNIKDVPF